MWDISVSTIMNQNMIPGDFVKLNFCWVLWTLLQTGFGWTNGVALALLHDYGWAENQPITSTYNLIPWFPT
jgi:hypothetical protein